MPAPSSTYRLQLHAGQTFQDAAALTDYLAALGVGALYASPMLESSPGSNHGYDVTDPGRVSGERGGEQGRRAMVTALRDAGLQLLVDIVPNHVGVAVPTLNPWWSDVLVHGRESRYATFFDVDWNAGRILLPVLGAETADDEPAELDRLELVRDENGYPGLRYYEHLFPVAHGSADHGTPREVHDRQHYRLVAWRRGAAELTYRRFFDVSDLAAVRVEDPVVFEAAHREVLRWVAEGGVDGLRVDHPDGLTDPGGYLRRLRAALGPDRWLLVEKILGVGETLPASWPVDGTTGYEALREISGVFVDPTGAGLLTQFAAEHTGERLAAHTVERRCRRLVADTILAAEVRRIAALLIDTDSAKAVDAVAELLSSFPVYRSYLPERRSALDVAVSVARTNRPDLTEIFESIHRRMLTEPDGELALRVQQTSGMVTAKGVEDTTFYRWNRLVALNEVGGDPAKFGVPVDEFHAGASARQASTPLGMTTLSTHDTKRSEDVRARLAVLAELPREWADAMRGWAARYPLPERSLELLAWQCLIGAWPISADRMADYLLKAAKEAKLATSHVNAVAEVDDAIRRWPADVLADTELVAEIESFVARIAPHGWSNSLGQKLLQLAGPGIPDVYQGTECFEYSLVDPDNRRPVDFAARRELLARLDDHWLPDVDESGAAKLLVTSSALRLRRYRPELFEGYRPLAADGPAADHVVAFARHPGLVAVATRMPVGLAARGGWSDTVLALPDGAADFTDVITGEPVNTAAPRMADLLSRYPVALLVRPA
ncbi:malto-oligosyltrehalose synthase [Pseudonocardia spinosispora]|uniref:malto-oligosyltrehalose synthase n=1 Tax=Pseudonocardia spinosispora TaxID=103441 RepID=UPI000422E292|nr:malto-oligosyltrehalose synthase [Pseudonocardia spinosispora]